jgi:hypothetical protein
MISFQEKRILSKGYKDGMLTAIKAIIKATVINTDTDPDDLDDAEYVSINQALSTLIAGVRMQERQRIVDAVLDGV